MKHGIRTITALLLALLLLGSVGCLVNNTASTTDSSKTETKADPSAETAETAEAAGDRDAVAIRLDDIEIKAGEIEDNYASYVQMMTYYGMTAPTDREQIDEILDMIIEDLIAQRLPMWKAKQLGVTLSEDELSAVDADAHNQADAEYTDLVLSYASYYTDAGEVTDIAQLTEEQLNDAIYYLNLDVQGFYNDSMADIDVYVADAYDHYKEEGTISAYADKLRAKSDAEVAADEATVEAWYETNYADQKEQFDADPTLYRDVRENILLGSDTTPLLYVPEGLAIAKVLAFTPDGDAPAELAENEAALKDYEAEYGALALNGGDEARMAEILAAYTALKTETDALGETYGGKAKAAAEAAYARLVSGEDFDTVAKDAEGYAGEQVVWYTGEDPETAEIVRTTLAALQEGAYSGVVTDGENYYIVQLVGRLAAGPADRLPIEEAILAAATAEAQEAAWNEQLDAWQQEALNAAERFADAYAYVGN